MSDAPSPSASSGPPPTLPAFDLVRAAVAFSVMAIVPTMLWPTVARWWGDATLAAHREANMLGFLVACAAVAMLPAVLGRAWAPGSLRPLAVVGRYAAFLPLWLALAYGWLRLLRALGEHFEVQGGLDYFAAGGADLGSPGFWVVTATVVVGAPVAEEIVFRGYLQTGLRGWLQPRWGHWPAILLTAAAFGAVHPPGTRVPIAVLGALLGWLRHRYDGLLAPVYCHMLHNATTVTVVSLWPASLELLYPR